MTLIYWCLGVSARGWIMDLRRRSIVFLCASLSLQQLSPKSGGWNLNVSRLRTSWFEFDSAAGAVCQSKVEIDRTNTLQCQRWRWLALPRLVLEWCNILRRICFPAWSRLGFAHRAELRRPPHKISEKAWLHECYELLNLQRFQN